MMKLLPFHRQIAIATMTLLIGVVPAFALCPAPAAGDSAEMTAGNQQRLLCQHREIYNSDRDRQLQMQIENNRRLLQDLQMQRRLDTIAKPIEPIVIPPIAPLQP